MAGVSSLTVTGVLADLVVLLHLFWILFLILGAIPGRRRVWVRRLHLSALGLAAILTAGGWICPLTYLEVWLRGGWGDGRSNTFVGYYVERLIYLDVPRWLVLTAVFGLAGLSLTLYRRRRPGRREG